MIEAPNHPALLAVNEFQTRLVDLVIVRHVHVFLDPHVVLRPHGAIQYGLLLGDNAVATLLLFYASTLTPDPCKST